MKLPHKQLVHLNVQYYGCVDKITRVSMVAAL